MNFYKAFIFGIPLIMVIAVLLSCGDNPTDNNDGLAIFGRIIWRSPLAGSPAAEFHIYNNGEPTGDAKVVVNEDTIDAVPGRNGFYRGNVAVDIGDTAYYAVVTIFGSEAGVVSIPDTVPIVEPARIDTFGINSSHGAVWRSNTFVDGYYAHLGRQFYEAGIVYETNYDTTLTIPGLGLLETGIDTFWVETLRGPFEADYTPDDIMLPRGVVGAAANYCELHFILD